MNKLVKYIVQQNYNRVKKVLKLLNKTNSLKIYYLTMRLHRSEIVNDDFVYFVSFSILVNHNSLVKHIESNIHGVSNLVKMIKRKIKIDSNILNFINNAKEWNGQFSWNTINTSNYNIFVDGMLYEIVRSYDDIEFRETLRLRKRYKATSIKQILSEEMDRRLRNICDILGGEYLGYIGVLVITNIEYDRLDYEERCFYYKRCIKRLVNDYNKKSDEITERNIILKEIDKLKEKYDILANDTNEIDDIISKYIGKN